MNGVIEKLGSYQLLTNLLPGAFFTIAMNYFWGVRIPADNLAEEFLVYYFIGLIVGRIGSLVIEPLLKKLKVLQFTAYPSFVKAVKADPKIDTLSEMNNYLRSLVTCLILLPLMKVLQVMANHWIWFSLSWKWILLATLILIFILSYRKHCKFIRNRVDIANKLADENKDAHGEKSDWKAR